ncbi:Six-hairpin glycosidase-like protein [Gilbertella persicaria]|uniref:Six-hairpin glycosidase-like protein n=1 Tax=Gilbertella persicaria TaxID=101096 RepID=UPI00222008C9|nr:Six-hairpin glycosidase-like protein [Gilbertella persicaria]KAI8063654.1 Six-hairpin glycosidase-like protein [Gilbertella persicaria]
MRPFILSSIALSLVQCVFAVEQPTTDGLSNPPGVTGNVHYANLLNVSMWFYEAQRSGYLPANNRVPWRSNSGLQDGSDNNVNLTGGYYDAGDYLKFSLPLAYSLSSLAWGASTWFDGYQKANQVGYLRDTIKWGTDWLIQAHPNNDTFYVQVGDGDIDNNYWGPDTGIPTPRPSYQVNRTAVGTDAVAISAAALASASYLFRNYINDTDYANTLLTSATSLFNLADTAQPRNVYTNAIPAIAEFYNTNNYTSQLTYAALWMYKATNNVTYRTMASDYFDAFKLDHSQITVMDWSDQTNAVFVLGAEVDATNPKYATAAKKVLDAITTSGSGSPCTFTNGGLLWCDGYSTENSLIPAQDMALLALLYSRLDSSKSDSYTQFALNQINYLLGNNYMNTPYVCGIHKNSPRNPHHAGASGGTDIGNINGSPAEETHILYGAIIGGPDKQDKFYDIRDDYSQTEVALDYNAPFQGLVAYQISTNAADPPYVTITADRPSVSRSSGIPHWLIAVIVICVVFVIALVSYVLYWKRVWCFNRGYNKA